MSSFGGSDVDFAQLVSGHDDSPLSEEARERITSARIRDLSFLVKKVSARSLDSASTNGLALALAEVEDTKQPFTRYSVEKSLRGHGYGIEEAAHLAGAIFQ